MKRILVTLTVLGSLTACGSTTAASPSGVTVVPQASIDATAWAAQMNSALHSTVYSASDLPAEYESDAADCLRPDPSYVDRFVADQFGTQWAIARVDATYICPGAIPAIDAANTQAASVVSQACNMSAPTRTPAQEKVAVAHHC